MSRIYVFEVPDACDTTGSAMTKKLREIDPCIEFRMGMSFADWVDIAHGDPDTDELPLLVQPSTNLKYLAEFLHQMRRTPMEDRPAMEARLAAKYETQTPEAEG